MTKKKSPLPNNDPWEMRLAFPASRLPTFMTLARGACLDGRIRIGMIPGKDVEAILSRIADRHGNITIKITGNNLEDKMWVMLFR